MNQIHSFLDVPANFRTLLFDFGILFFHFGISLHMASFFKDVDLFGISKNTKIDVGQSPKSQHSTANIENAPCGNVIYD